MDYMLNFEFWEAFTCSYANELGFAVFGLLVYTGVALPIYIRTDSATIPAVLFLIIGGLVSSQIAGPGNEILLPVVVLTVAGAIAGLVYAYNR